MSVQAVLSGEKRWHVEASDVTAFLRSLPEGCVQVCITSPPYWQLRSYLKKDDPLKPLEIGQEPTPDAYVERLVGVFREVRRVLADHGTLWVNVGDSYNSTPPGNKNPMSKSGLNGVQTSAAYRARMEETQQAQQEHRLKAVGLKPLDQCCVPHRLYLALIADGWYGRADCVWAKRSAMPISVRGWRWERCRVKVKAGTWQTNSKGLVRGDGTVAPNPDHSRNPAVQPQYADCPGCKKCERTGGLVLRKGSWRPTSAHEYLFLLARSPNYFMDGDAVRTPLSPVTVQRDQYSRVLDDPDEQCAVAHDHETVGNPSGANPRDVFRHDATAADVFAWLADQDPALGEALHQKWREQQGMHDVLWVGPEPLKAAHYAAFPTALVTPLLRASTSERGQCPACGMPWARVIDRPVTKRNGDVKPNERDGGLTAQHGLERTGMSHYAYDQWLKDNPTKTVGWKASCECAGDPVPQIVLDPFAGSGRTGMAARRLGLRFLGCELNSEFAELANAQIAADAIDVPLAQGKAGPSLFDALEGRP